jgi:signal transduction histidine kinase
MERYRKSAVYLLITFAIFTTFVMFSEIPLISESQRFIFIVTKLAFILPTLPLAYFLNKDPTSSLFNALVGIDFALYAAQGQFFRPFYVFSISVLTVAFGFLFSASKTVFRWTTAFGFILFTAVFLLRWDQYVEQLQHPAKSDIILASLSFCVAGWFANTYFTSDRLFREEAMLKFAKIGTQTSRIVHDLKGLTSSPLLYLQVLESKLPPSLEKEVGEAMGLLARDLEGFRRTLFELNQLTAARVDHNVLFSFSDVVSSLQVLLRKQLNNISVITEGEMRLETDKGLLTSMSLSVLMNSVEAFEQRKIRDRKIFIRIKKNQIGFYDNGGGFDQNVLDNLARGQFLSTRPHGSGLGLMFVFDGMKNIGGKAKVFNVDGGACVEFQFPKTVFRPESV